MSNIGQILVTTTSMLNVLYSVIYLIITISDAKRRLIGPHQLVLWFIMYSVNMALNIILGCSVGLRKKHIIIWSIFTVILSIFRWTCLPYHLHGKKYFVVSVLINVYILLTFFLMCSISEKPKQTASTAGNVGDSTRPELNERSSEKRFEDYSLPSISKFTSTLEEIDECTSPREITITKMVRSPSTNNIVEFTTTKIITAGKKDNETSPFTMKSTIQNKYDPSSDMHKIFSNDNPKPDVPVCVHPFGWNVKGGSALISAPSHPEASDPLIETFVPSAPTLDDIVDDS